MSAINGETLLRQAVIAADAAVPEVAQGVADLTGSPFATIGFSLGGTNPSFTVYPLLWNETLDKYLLGSAEVVTADIETNIAVNGCTDVYLYVSAVSGTNPSMDVTIKPALL